MIIKPSVLGLITTNKCTASCDHCCFSCSPGNDRFIPYERMERLIEEAAEIPSIKLVTFTGGECFLLGDDLDSLVKKAYDYGLNSRCVSNGYWAKSVQFAEDRINGLVDLGLTEMNFSTGGMHMKHVPVERVVNAAYACAQADIKAMINVEVYTESEFRMEMITGHPLLEGPIKDKKVLIHQNNWMTTGGKGTITHPPSHSRFNEANKSPCLTCLDAIAVTPDLDLFACCGFSISRIPELRLGSVKDRKLADVLEDAPDDFLKIWIHIEGPERILDFVKAHRPDYELPVQFVHPCETCDHLYHDDTAKAVLREHYGEVEGRIKDLYFAELASKTISSGLSIACKHCGDKCSAQH